MLVHLRHDGNDAGLGMGLRIGRIQAVYVGEDDEQVGFDEIADHSRQGIVVADFKLVDSYDIVFVDDGDDAHLQHRQQGIARIHELLTVLGIHARQQYLTDVLPVFAEHLFISVHEDALPDGATACFSRIVLGRADSPFN